MAYVTKLQVIQRGGQNRQYYLICPAPLAAALEITDRIIMLDQGRIAAVGKHDELMRTCEPYRRLYEAQLLPLSA